MKKIISILVISILLIISCTTKPSESLRENPFLGSWKMKKIHYIYTDTTYIGDPINYGTFIYTPKRYCILYNPWTDKRKAFDTLSKPTNKEIKSAFNSIVFNSGQYTYTDSTITSIADIAKVPGFEGGKQYYKYRINNDTLQITMFDETYPNGEKPKWFGKLNVKFYLTKE